jgi:predicted ester cyclase
MERSGRSYADSTRGRNGRRVEPFPEEGEAAMKREEIESLDDRGMSAWDTHDADAFADLFAETFELTDPALPEPITTRDGARAYAQGWFTAFPDMMIKQTHRVVGDDAVAGQVEFTGTNTGPMSMAGNEIAPTGKAVTGRGAYFVRVRDGKVIEFNSLPDIAGLMMQLGFMPQM